MIKVIKTIDSFEELQDMVWSGALDTLNTVKEYNKENELMDLLSDFDWESDTSLNDYLWFDADNIFEILGIEEEE